MYIVDFVVVISLARSFIASVNIVDSFKYFNPPPPDTGASKTQTEGTCGAK